jgi:hypothetical protein
MTGVMCDLHHPESWQTAAVAAAEPAWDVRSPSFSDPRYRHRSRIGNHGPVARRSGVTPLYTDDGSPGALPAADLAAPKRRRGGSWRDMAYSLAILLVPIIIAVGVWQYLSSDHQVNTIDPAGTVQQAREAGRFPVATPTGLSSDWHATSAANSIKGDTLTMRIGYITPSGGFAQLVESNDDSARLLSGTVPSGARPGGAERIAGRDWSRYTGEKDREVLALLEPHRTVLVVGQTSDSELRELALSLRG